MTVPKDIDYNRLRNIMNELHSLPDSMRSSFPSILRESHSIMTQANDEYLLLVFVSKEEEKRIKKFKNKKMNPFPGLIRLQNEEGQTAISLNSSQKFLLIGNAITNLYSLKLGADCSVIIQNHKQSIKTKELGAISYKIELAYLLSYGTEITKHNVLEYLDDLIAFSINTWRA